MTDLLARILPWIDLHCWIIIGLTHRQLETHGCVVSTVNNYDYGGGVGVGVGGYVIVFVSTVLKSIYIFILPRWKSSHRDIPR